MRRPSRRKNFCPKDTIREVFGTACFVSLSQIKNIRPQFTELQKGMVDMKGYDTASGYMGYIDGRYVLFASEAEYADYMEEEEAA